MIWAKQVIQPTNNGINEQGSGKVMVDLILEAWSYAEKQRVSAADRTGNKRFIDRSRGAHWN